MRGTMTDPANAEQAGVVRFRYDRFVAAMTRLGHTTERGRCRASGVTRTTIFRWRTQPIQHTPLTAHRVAAISGLTVDQLFEPVDPGRATPA